MHPGCGDCGGIASSEGACRVGCRIGKSDLLRGDLNSAETAGKYDYDGGQCHGELCCDTARLGIPAAVCPNSTTAGTLWAAPSAPAGQPNNHGVATR